MKNGSHVTQPTSTAFTSFWLHAINSRKHGRQENNFSASQLI